MYRTPVIILFRAKLHPSTSGAVRAYFPDNDNSVRYISRIIHRLFWGDTALFDVVFVLVFQ